ncbi:MAG: AAA family ATPase [Victivallales bacterium]|nr:AAA family ATPase [Victivallales bacterium]
MMKDLTSYVYSFEDLIQGNFLYVDKTEYIWQLIRPRSAGYFLSRPRRFGKSLTLSTLKAVFQGKKELFKGLAIYDKPYDWKPYPVIHLSFADYNPMNATVEKLNLYLYRKVKLIARELNVILTVDDDSSQAFAELIDSFKFKSQVVILVDEYDKPILDNITNPDVKEILKCLKGFYSVLKDRNMQERLLFVTGVSKFCHVSLFSDLNNLTDITMDARYATMLGYTQQEFESNFSEEIQAVEKTQRLSHKALLDKIKVWYDGFRFEENSETVYNPVSLASFFEMGGKFSNYWFQTGTSSFLLELIMKSKFNYSEMLSEPVSEAFFNAFEITRLKPMVLLFQTGYLTIKNCIEKEIPFTSQTIREYYLHFPNLEVERSFNEQLLEYCTAIQTESTTDFLGKLITAVGTGDADGFMKLFQSVFANIPYSIHVKDEHYYQTVFYVVCDLLKLMVQAEVCTSDGRIDMMVSAGEWIYVIEFKLNKSADRAMKQIEDKNYVLKYLKEGKRIMQIGVNFDFNAGNITDWIKEEYS